jgi:aubergine-like protein
MKEETNFYNKFFNTVQAKLKLIPIGRKFFDPAGAVDLPQHKLTLWPGFFTAVGEYDAGCLVNIDISHRCLRTNTVLDMLSGMMNQPDFRQKANKLLVGGTVLTLYNKKTYRIDEIDFNSTPMNEFNDHTGTAMTYCAYYERRWNKKITNEQQPLLVCKLKKITAHLIPELCVHTGLTDEIRADFNIMKDMANATKKEPVERLDSCRALIRSIEGNEEARAEMESWKAGIDQTALELKGHVINPGTIGLGGGKSFGINPNTCSFDRECQATMHSQPPLNCWGVFYCQMD